MMIDGIDIDASSSIHVTFKPMNSFNQGLSSTSVTSNRPRTNSGMASPREVPFLAPMNHHGCDPNIMRRKSPNHHFYFLFAIKGSSYDL